MLDLVFIATFFALTVGPFVLVIWLLVHAARAATRTVNSCRGCGYDLRNLGERRNCPECGQAYAVDVHGDVIS